MSKYRVSVARAGSFEWTYAIETYNEQDKAWYVIGRPVVDYPCFTKRGAKRAGLRGLNQLTAPEFKPEWEVVHNEESTTD